MFPICNRVGKLFSHTSLLLYFREQIVNLITVFINQCSNFLFANITFKLKDTISY